MNRLALLPFALASLALLGGCSIPIGMEEAPTQLNQCATASECGAGATCLQGMCVTQSADLTGLLLEVRPNSGASFGASTSYIVDPGQVLELAVEDEQGVSRGLDVALPPLVQISSGNVHFEYASACAVAADQSFPATFFFTRADTRFRGFPKAVYSATSEWSADTQGFGFDIEIPPGTYDVYVQPQPIEGCADTLPAFLYPQQLIDGKTPLAWGLFKPTHLTGDIKIPDGGNIDGWLLDIVEPQGGRVVSTTQTLTQEGLAIQVPIDLKFVWEDTKSSPYIRLRPPDGVPKPTVYWGLWESIINSSSTSPEVYLTVEDLVIEPRTVEIQVEDQGHAGVAAAVEIQSIELSGKVATNATYGVTIPATDERGIIKTKLPPGDYRVRVVPTLDTLLAITEQDISIPPLDKKVQKDDPNECFCGQAITVRPKATLLGNVILPGGEPMFAAGVAITPSQLPETSLWKRLHALDPALPQPWGTSLDQYGNFSLIVDPGASDLTVQPESGTNYPWMVRPRVTVQPSDTVINLDTLVLTHPALLAGRITDPDGAPITDTNIDAWLPVVDPEADDGLAGTVIRIATTTTDAEGRYTLLLPATISQ